MSIVDWEIHFIDSTTVRAHQHAAGAKKVVQSERLLGVVVVASVQKSTFVVKVQAGLSIFC